MRLVLAGAGGGCWLSWFSWLVEGRGRLESRSTSISTASSGNEFPVFIIIKREDSSDCGGSVDSAGTACRASLCCGEAIPMPGYLGGVGGCGQDDIGIPQGIR